MKAFVIGLTHDNFSKGEKNLLTSDYFLYLLLILKYNCAVLGVAIGDSSFHLCARCWKILLSSAEDANS